MELERLKQRLRAMTVAQLRGRWKRIEERLADPIRMVGEASHKELKENLTVLEDLPIELNSFLEAPSPSAESEDAEWRLWYRARHEGGLALLLAEITRDDLKTILDHSSLDLTKAREFIIQRDLLWKELESRGERPPGHEEPEKEAEKPAEVSEASESEVTEATPKKNEESSGTPDNNVTPDNTAPLDNNVPPDRPDVSKSPRARARSSRRNRSKGKAANHPKDKAGDLMERVGKNIKDKMAESTKNAAGSAAKASGKAFWKMATSAFRGGGTSTKNTETPSTPSRRRRRRRRGAGDNGDEETLELIEKLHELKERGILSHEEFEQKKSDLLGRL